MENIQAIQFLELEQVNETNNSSQLPVAPNPILLLNLCFQVQQGIHSQLNNAHSTVSAPPRLTAVAGRGVGADAPTPPVPAMPPSGAPAPVQPSGSLTNPNLTGDLDQLEKILEYISNNPTDPSGPINLMISLINLGPAALNNPSIQSLLDAWNVSGIIQFAMDQGALSAVFFGYDNGDGSGVQNGLTGLQNYVTQMYAVLNALGGPNTGNQYLDEMYNDFNNEFSNGVELYYAGCTLPNGDLGFKYNGVSYDWSNPSDANDDRYFIEQLIGTDFLNQNYYAFFKNLNQNNGANEAERTYRLTALQELLTEFKNPEIVIMLWMMMAYDQTFQGQESGLATTTNYLSTITNSYATPLLTQAQNIGNMTPADALEFAQDLYNGTNLINILPQTSSLSQLWNDNVFGEITNMQVTLPGTSSPTTLGQLMQNAISNPNDPTALQNLQEGLNSLNPSTSGSSSVNAGYQTIVNSLTQGGALASGISKTVDAQLSTVANVDNEVVKLGDTMASPTGGGLAQLMLSIVQNQVSR